MRAHDDHGRRGGVGGSRARAPRPQRRRLLLLAGGLTLGVVPVAAAVAQQRTTTVAVQDRSDARSGVPDLKRVAATRTAGGGLRLAVSLDAELEPADLLPDADDGGPPGSICVRLWTTSTPQTTRPDLLACVTARADGRQLRGTITRDRPDGFATTLASVTPTRPSSRSVALRVAPGLLGRARRVAFSGEATRPGCARLSCVDLAPDDGATRTLRLR